MLTTLADGSRHGDPKMRDSQPALEALAAAASGLDLLVLSRSHLEQLLVTALLPQPDTATKVRELQTATNALVQRAGGPGRRAAGGARSGAGEEKRKR